MILTVKNASQYIIGNRSVNQSDYIGVFYQKNGIEECAGYTQLINDSLELMVSNDSLGLLMYLKMWDGITGCIVDSVLIGNTNWNMQFDTSSYFIAGIQGIVYKQVYYTNSTFCINNSDLISPAYFPAPFEASFFAGSLELDTSSGKFTPSLNQPGTYWIHISSKFCLTKDTSQVIITDLDTCFVTPPVNKENILAPSSGNPDYQKIIFNTPGKISIFNVQGVELRTLYGPVEWDGTDNQGRPLPTDDYYILLESGEQKIVTIIR